MAGDTSGFSDVFVRDRHSDGCTITGGAGDDTFYGTPGDDVICGLGGNDHLSGGTNADALIGGPGTDLASYFGRIQPVTVTIDGVANDGASNERDDIRSDVERLAGGHGDDSLTGNGADNRLTGNAGNDRLIGGGGRDQLVGGDGDDSHDASEGTRDSVICGAGLDSVLSDPVDWLSATCENR